MRLAEFADASVQEPFAFLIRAPGLMLHVQSLLVRRQSLDSKPSGYASVGHWQLGGTAGLSLLLPYYLEVCDGLMVGLGLGSNVNRAKYNDCGIIKRLIKRLRERVNLHEIQILNNHV